MKQQQEVRIRAKDEEEKVAVEAEMRPLMDMCVYVDVPCSEAEEASEAGCVLLLCMGIMEHDLRGSHSEVPALVS